MAMTSHNAASPFKDDSTHVLPKIHSRLRWRCRRGTRELDLLLQAFLRESYHGLDEAGQQRFAELLEYSDPEIMDWLMRRSVPPCPEFQLILSRLCGASQSPESDSQ